MTTINIDGKIYSKSIKDISQYILDNLGEYSDYKDMTFEQVWTEMEQREEEDDEEDFISEVIYYDSYKMDEAEAEKYDAGYCLYTWQRDFEDDNECQYFKTLKELRDVVLSNDDWVYEKELTWTLGDLRIELDDFIKNREAFDLLVDFINGRKKVSDLIENKFGLEFDSEYENGSLDKIVFSQKDFGFDCNGYNIICYIAALGPEKGAIISNSHLPLEFYNLLTNNNLIEEDAVVEINKD